VIGFAFWRYDFAEKDKIKMIMSSYLNGEVNNDSIVLEFDMEVIFVLDGVRDFDSDFSWSLIPGVCDLEVMANKFLFGHIFFSEFDD
jgi:hypothetical protein